jgi:hypothetical protein
MTVPASIGDNRFYLEVSRGEIAITAPDTSYCVVYHRVSREGGLIIKSSSGMTNEEAPMTHAEFLARAWNLANDTARGLGWIV